jgi:hypothetical protein
MRDDSHLNALELGLSHERARLANAKTDAERALRAVWVNGYEKQVADERKRLGMSEAHPELSDDDLLEALGA